MNDVSDRFGFQSSPQLYNLINIGIARDSKELAEASKRDSSSMKIIAVLTTLFLPGTFIAVRFTHTRRFTALSR